jgi:hypothetical protein
MKGIAGLHLWAVELSNGDGQQLWITTASRDPVIAAQKAKTFLRTVFRKKFNRPRAAVHTITNHGTIDA